MIEQLNVRLPNRPGTLEGMVSALAEAGVDMKALNVSDRGPDHGEASMIVSDVDKALAALEAAGHTVTRQPVLVVEMDDKVGGLAAILRALRDEQANIAQLYAFVSRHESKALAVVRVDESARAAGILERGGFRVLSQQSVAQRGTRPQGPTPLEEHLGLDFIW